MLSKAIISIFIQSSKATHFPHLILKKHANSNPYISSKEKACFVANKISGSPLLLAASALFQHMEPSIKQASGSKTERGARAYPGIPNLLLQIDRHD
jgi:23S rRNA A2030 N6-methylase RlmJ